jgi:hypothetical protein
MGGGGVLKISALCLYPSIEVENPLPPTAEWGGPSNETGKKRCPVSQQVWHDKDPSILLKGPKRRA